MESVSARFVRKIAVIHILPVQLRLLPIFFLIPIHEEKVKEKDFFVMNNIPLEPVQKYFRSG